LTSVKQVQAETLAFKWYWPATHWHWFKD